MPVCGHILVPDVVLVLALYGYVQICYVIPSQVEVVGSIASRVYVVFDRFAFACTAYDQTGSVFRCIVGIPFAILVDAPYSACQVLRET